MQNNLDFQFNRRPKFGKPKFFEVCVKRTVETHLKQCCLTHSVSAAKFEQDLFILNGYISLRSTAEPF